MDETEPKPLNYNENLQLIYQEIRMANKLIYEEVRAANRHINNMHASMRELFKLVKTEGVKNE